MRKCSRCKIEKPLSDFHPRNNRKTAFQSHCKSCNKDAVIERTQTNKRKAVEHFGGKCNRCGYKKCVRALHFHHKDPLLKDDMFHRLRNRKIEFILATLTEQGCELLCSNCHAEEHCGCNCALPLS